MAKSAANETHGSWLSFAAQMRLPNIRRAFDLNRDPHIAAQLNDLDKTEAQRRAALSADPGQTSEDDGDQSGSGSGESAPPKNLKAQRNAAFQSYQNRSRRGPASDHYQAHDHTSRHGPSL